jgi:hypothetical protein
LAGPRHGELRLSGSLEDTGTLISVLERLAAGLPVTTVGVEILHRTGPEAARWLLALREGA